MYGALSDAARQVLSQEFGIENASVDWKRPESIEHGDAATAVALQVAGRAKTSPSTVAAALVKELTGHADVERIEVAGPGYVNVWLTPAALLRGLNETREACTAKVKRTKDAPVIVEYSQPNIAKPLGVHHLLSTLIGQAIGNLYEHAGYPVIRWNYLGDYGTQFGKLAVAAEKWGTKKDISTYSIDELLALYVKFHEEAEKQPELEDEAREAFRKLEQGDAELRAFWESVVGITKDALSVLYTRLNVQFDTDLGESFYEDKMDSVLEEGRKKRVFTEGEGGSLIVEFPESSGFPPYLVQKSDGATLYSTRDIAQMRYRIDEFHPEEILIVTDIAQKLHFEQLIATCHMLGWELPQFENVLVGRMRFADKKMSTRTGSVLKLEDVLDEAVSRAEKVIEEHGEKIQTDDSATLASMMGIGAVAYGILSQNRKMDMVFDWGKILSFDGNSAPYLQYTHARAQSVLRKAESDNLGFPDEVHALSDRERTLIGALLQFGTVLEEARTSHMPHVLSNYLYALCQDYNAFYNSEPILQAEEPARSFRLALTALTASVLKTGANLLTIHVPDRM